MDDITRVQHRESQMVPMDVMKILNAEATIDNKEIIIQHLIAEPGAIVLNEIQKKLLERWEKADALMRQHKYTPNEIIEILIKTFDIGIATARRDISDAQDVFGSSFKPNKTYLLTNLIARIDAAMTLMLNQGKVKEFAALTKTLLEAIRSLPDTSNVNPQPAAVFFNILPDTFKNMAGSNATEAEIIEIAGQVIESRGLDKNDFFNALEQ